MPGFLLIQSLLLAGAWQAGGPTKQPYDSGPVGAVTIRVYNYGPATPETLHWAEDHATKVLQRANVRLGWHHYDFEHGRLRCELACAPAPGSPAIVVKLLPDHMARRLPAPTDALAMALPTTVFVFLEKVASFAKSHGIDDSIILGATLAHEFGHILLDDPNHAAVGLMRSRWSTRELQKAAQGSLLFTPDQQKRLRTVVNRPHHR